MPNSVPPEPWKRSVRWAAPVISIGDLAVAVDPFEADRAGATATAVDVAAGGWAARGTTGGPLGRGVGGRRIFSRAAAYTEATTPHCAHLSFSTAALLQRGHVA